MVDCRTTSRGCCTHRSSGQKLIVQSSHTRQHAALQKLQRSAAASAYMTHAVREPSRFKCSYAVAAAHNRCCALQNVT